MTAHIKIADIRLSSSGASKVFNVYRLFEGEWQYYCVHFAPIAVADDDLLAWTIDDLYLAAVA